MAQSFDEKQISIRFSEVYKSRLDDLAKRGDTSRSQLMVNFIKIWLEELRESHSANFFHLAIILREIDAEFEMDRYRKSEFVELLNPSPEKPFPVRLLEDNIIDLTAFAGMCNMTRHNMMKTMIVTGIGELEALTDDTEYGLSVIEPKLKRAFGIIMARGAKAFMQGRKEKKPLKRKR